MTNTLAIACPKCQRELHVPPEVMGATVVCDHCQHSFHPKITIPCPQCRRSLQVRKEYLGKRIFCSYCKHTFKAAVEGGDDFQPAAPQWAVPGPIDTTADASKVKALQEEVEKLRVDLSARTSEHSTAMLSLQQTRGLVQQLQGQVHSYQQSKAQASPGLEQELAGLQTECNHLRSQMQAAQQRASDRDRFEQELRAAQENVARLQQELETERMMPPLPLPPPVDPPELNLLRGEREQLRGDLDAARAELNSVHGDLDTVRTELATRIADSEALARVTIDCNALREERETLRARQYELERECQARTDAAEQSTARVRESENALAEARAAGASLQARYEQEQQAQRTECEHLLAQDQTQRQELDALRGRVTELEESLSQAASGHEAFKIDWQRELAESRTRIETERQSYLTEVEQFRGRVSELEQSLTEARATSAEEISRLTSEAQTLRGEREQWRTREQTLTSEMEWLRVQIQDLQQMPAGPDGDIILTADALTRAVEEARGQWVQGQGVSRAQRDQEHQARVQEEAEHRYREALHRTSDLTQMEQETAILRAERDAAASQLATLTKERDRLAEDCEAIRASADETERSLRNDLEQLTAALPPEPAVHGEDAEMMGNGTPLPQRYLELAEQVRQLRAQVQAGGSGTKSERSSGWLGSLFGGKEEPGENPLARRLDTLRSEAMVERENLLLAELEAARADLEQQLAETRVQLQEAKARVESLELEMIQNQSSGPRYRPPGTRYDAAPEAPYSSPTGSTGTAATPQWRLDELT